MTPASNRPSRRARERIGIVTHGALPGLTPDDRLLQAALARAGFMTQALVWDAPEVKWKFFSTLILRSCWDYHLKIDRFKGWLDRLERMGIRVLNPVSMVRWNLEKTYLKELQNHGVGIPRTVWLEKGASPILSKLLDEPGFENAILKPTISASATRTRIIRRQTAMRDQPHLDEILGDTGAMIQEFLPELTTAGEWSFIFFGGRYSHAVIKKPKSGDFRVQMEFGGEYLPAEPPVGLTETVSTVLTRLERPPLYARVDGVERDGGFLLIELELIEPELFFRFEPRSAERFVKAFLTAHLGE